MNRGWSKARPRTLAGAATFASLEGGRVGGVWTIQGDAVFIVLEQQDDRWLVDEVIDIVEDNAATSGTPTS